MREKFSQIPSDTFKHLAINGGIIAKAFNPATGALAKTDILGAMTDAGVNVNVAMTYIDFAEGIANADRHTKELMKPDERTVTASGAFVTQNAELAKRLMGAADITTLENGVTKITPRDYLDIDEDFFDMWVLGDYSDKNVGNGAGFIACKLLDCLSTGGFQLQSAQRDKWTFAFEFTAHYSLDAQETPPFELYLKEGTTAPGVTVSRSRVTVPVGEKVKLSATTNPTNATVTWASNDTDKATVTDGEVTGVAAGYAVVTASITESAVTYTDICTVTVVAAS